jgi:simple sugar transport system permease protein
MGQDPHVAAIAGIAVERNRIVATVLSTVLAAWGQLLFLQNIGTLNTYSSHEQVGMFAIAALLVSGATVSRATVGQALLGTVLFHTLFVVSPLAGKALAGDAQIGEYFRVFVAYAVITVALVLHAWQSTRAAHEARKAAR